MRELAFIMESCPSLIYSKLGTATIIQQIPAIIQREKPKAFCYSFIVAVMNLYRERSLGAWVHQKDEKVDISGMNSRDWPLTLLRCYLSTLLSFQFGEYGTPPCFLSENICTDEFITVMHNYYHYEDPYELLGWIVLVIRYDQQSRIRDAIIETYYKNIDAMCAFLRVFVDCALPLTNRDQSCRLLARIINTTCYDAEATFGNEGSAVSPFINKCTDMDLGWLDEQIHAISKSYSEGPDQHAQEDCNDIFVRMSNIYRSNFVAENYFFEYLAQMSYFYPLIKQREDIAERYDRYFPGTAMMFMADISCEVIANFDLVDNYKDKEPVKAAERSIHLKAESIIIKLHRMYPEVPARIVELFFEDTLKAFGRGFSGAAPGCMNVISPMIYAIFEGDSKVLESDLDYIDLIAALEGSYGDDDDIQGSYGDSDNADSNADTGDLHVKAQTRKGTEAMKTAERKIYSAYHKYKSGEEKVNNTLTKALAAIKKAIVGDQQAVIINGKQFSPIGFLKKLLATVAIFNYSKIAAILFIIVSSVMKKKAKSSEKKKLLAELEAELEMVNEKIEDARGDGNREAKYDLMRTRNALQNAIKRIKYGMGAETKEPVPNSQYLKSTVNTPGYRG